MPVLPSTFRPPAWLRNGHLQTVWPVLRPRHWKLVHEPERLELPDGDFVDLAWLRRERGGPPADRLAVLTHGLESDFHAGYIRGMTAALQAAGWDALAWNFRSCGGEPNRLPRSYHSGETGDLGAVVRHAAERGGYDHVALVGFSLGGNMTLKYLGEAPPHPAVRAAAAISVPVDLASSAGALDRRRANRIYRRRFIGSLVGKVEAKAKRFPDGFDLRGIRRIRTFQEFDDRYTSRLHGFRDAADYWARSSARPYLAAIRVPTLLLNARDDSFLSPACFPHDGSGGKPVPVPGSAGARRTRRVRGLPFPRQSDLCRTSDGGVPGRRPVKAEGRRQKAEGRRWAACLCHPGGVEAISRG